MALKSGWVCPVPNENICLLTIRTVEGTSFSKFREHSNLNINIGSNYITRKSMMYNGQLGVTISQGNSQEFQQLYSQISVIT